MNEFALLLRISLRNLFASFLNVVIGLIILVGTLFFVVGGSLVNSIDSSMSRSIIGSVAGHAQVYQGSSKDKPALFDNWNPPDQDAIPDFSKVKGPLLQHPNVKTVVPMGINTAIVAFGNTVDQALEKLRKARTRRPGEPLAASDGAHREPQEPRAPDHQRDPGRLRQAVCGGRQEEHRRGGLKDLAKAASDEFWGSFDRDPFGHLEFLENKISSLVPDADFIFLSYVGTDLDAYQSAFDRMQIVDGTAVPKGRRGMLLSKYVYENQFKLKIANRLDKINEALTEKGKKIATDPDLQDLVKQNKTQTREIVLQLDPLSMAKAVTAMQAATGSKETDVAKLLPLFLDTNDANFAARYKAFYSDIAPLIELYRLKPGEVLTIKAYTKSGFVEAVNVKVYGTFQFKGLEKSGLAGSLSLMDLMSFRDLYGYVTPEKIAETKQLEKASGAKYVSRADAEADLFGGGAQRRWAPRPADQDRREGATGRRPPGARPGPRRQHGLHARTRSRRAWPSRRPSS